MPAGRHHRAEVIVALAVMGLGLCVLAGSLSINLGSGYDRIGPRFFPLFVAAGLVVSGGFMAREAVRRGRLSDVESPIESSNLAALGTLILALASSVLLLERAGFILSASLLFLLVARSFESRRPWRDAVAGVLLAVLAYVAFTRGLGLVLPRGFLDGLL